MSIKSFNNIIGNRSRGLPTRSAVPQSTTLPRTPIVCQCEWNSAIKRALIVIGKIFITVEKVDEVYSWVKRDQLDVTCFIISLFNAQHVSDFNTSILRSLRLICWVISWVVLPWFDVCWCYVVVWLWWCGSASARIRIPHHLSQTTT